ncbi:hypothetical protein DFQ30_005657 [Apophysomyces sp. BC1015]|nr:hypothetical protein DFQ30_005657 [Apophysomyces sp. BC1015]KAG0170524.1 hypothetical protein DFQ29_009222 [Apophysomyces sp. BC1021]
MDTLPRNVLALLVCVKSTKSWHCYLDIKNWVSPSKKPEKYYFQILQTRGLWKDDLKLRSLGILVDQPDFQEQLSVIAEAVQQSGLDGR